MRYRRLIAAAGALGGVALALHFNGVASAADTPQTPPDLVEDYAYPNAKEILEKESINLLKGNGKIMLATCDDDASQIKVRRSEVGPHQFYCFSVAKTGAGFLTMELDRVYLIEGADRDAQAQISVGQVKRPPVDIPADDLVAVGGDDPNKATLLELRVGG